MSRVQAKVIALFILLGMSSCGRDEEVFLPAPAVSKPQKGLIEIKETTIHKGKMTHQLTELDENKIYRVFLANKDFKNLRLQRIQIYDGKQIEKSAYNINKGVRHQRYYLFDSSNELGRIVDRRFNGRIYTFYALTKVFHEGNRMTKIKTIGNLKWKTEYKFDGENVKEIRLVKSIVSKGNSKPDISMEETILLFTYDGKDNIAEISKKWKNLRNPKENKTEEIRLFYSSVKNPFSKINQSTYINLKNLWADKDLKEIDFSLLSPYLPKSMELKGRKELFSYVLDGKDRLQKWRREKGNGQITEYWFEYR